MNDLDKKIKKSFRVISILQKNLKKVKVGN